ncbi:hypothetical protein [Streptomyces sp. Isolate_45]|uniref:hypothetical protein n=1 Tax=Streptomyces sp. Isolate_45 TaxID=2950111 RepID=UPI002481E7AE|nr:hypothetical protein [Streptomyces sp. Isolate_45]MDA5281083.1 hypothetical protein [Streptomyces sp. Isolate_45]
MSPAPVCGPRTQMARFGGGSPSEQAFALLHRKRLAVRWERHTELHGRSVSLACSLICWRRFNKPDS